MAVHYHRGRERAEAAGGELVLGADLTVEAEVDRLFAEARDGLGGLDACVAVAGVWPSDDVPVWDCRSSAGSKRSGRTSPPRSSPRAATCASWSGKATGRS